MVLPLKAICSIFVVRKKMISNLATVAFSDVFNLAAFLECQKTILFNGIDYSFLKNSPEHNFSFYYYYNLKYFYTLIISCFIRKIICFLNKFKKYNLNEKIRKCFLSLSACPRCISAAHRRNVRPFNSVCQKKNRVSSSLVSHSLKNV